MDPIFKQMAVEFGNQVQFLKVNGDENPELIGRYSVQSLPTFIFLREGQIVNRLIGSRPKGQFKVEIQNFVEEAYTNTATQIR